MNIAEEEKKGVVYEVPCKECEHIYICETKRTLKKRLTKHKAAVKRGDESSGIAMHAWKNNTDQTGKELQ